MTEFFDRNGKRMTLMQWARAWEDIKYRVLGSHYIGNLWVSTVWLGIDHDVLNAMREHKHPPQIFESMIFERLDDEGWGCLEMRRYRTERDAMVGHTELVHIANTIETLGKEVTDDPDDGDRDVHLLSEAQGGEAEREAVHPDEA